jgi:putative phosphoribosyl transferase
MRLIGGMSLASSACADGQNAAVSFDLQTVQIPPLRLEGMLGVPQGAQALVIFAHGSGSGRLSPRNQHVAAELRKSGLATLLLDLLTPSEERDRRNVFDIDLLAHRLGDATRWARIHPETENLAVGYFGASTGGGAALLAASRAENEAAAVVSRGGRPDLAGAALADVRAPTLLIVGGLDTQVMRLNEEALAQMSCEKRLAVVPGASHLFEEPGTLDEVVRLSSEWFTRHLARDTPKS